MIRPLPATLATDEILARAEWWAKVRFAAPLAPAWFSLCMARVLSSPFMNTAALLALADALDEASDLHVVNGEPDLAGQMRALADLPRDLAPRRARRPMEF